MTILKKIGEGIGTGLALIAWGIYKLFGKAPDA